MKKKIFAGVLALSMFLVPTARADELTDPYIKDIKNGNILPPQYEIRDENGDGVDDDLGISRDKVDVDDWIKSVESQGEVSKIDGAIKWKRTQKEFKIKKENQNGKSVKDVTFTAYNTKEDAENNRNPIGKATSGEGGYVDFKNVPLYYEFYIKETSVPEGYDISKEIIPVYRDNGVRFLGEKVVTNSKVIKIGETEEGSGVNLNEYLQSLVVGSKFNEDTNWLVFNDNGTEKLIPKKPLKYLVSWNNINNAKLVFGEKELTLDGKRYKIRLMRAFNDSTGVNDENSWQYNKDEFNSHVKGSEWNRLILPLIGVNGKETDTKNSKEYLKNPYGRFGNSTESYTEQNMPALAEYTWWKDFGGNSKSSGEYDKGNYYGSYRWTQDKRNSYRALRGYNHSNNGAAYSSGNYPDYYNDYYYGWLPVLELAENN